MSEPFAPPSPVREPSSWRQRITLRRIGLLALVALAFGILIVTGSRRSTGTGTDDLTVTSNPGIERLIPARGDEILQQAPVGIDLAAGFEASLSVDGTPIPPDQLDVEPALNTITFRAGPGKAVEDFPGGEVCVEARVWRAAESPAEGTSVPWCFNVL